MEQAGAEQGQAQLQLELGFTLIKVCYLTLMINHGVSYLGENTFFMKTNYG